MAVAVVAADPHPQPFSLCAGRRELDIEQGGGPELPLRKATPTLRAWSKKKYFGR
jgi:hypothetical protein